MAAVYSVQLNKTQVPQKPVCVLYRKMQASLYRNVNKLPCITIENPEMEIEPIPDGTSWDQAEPFGISRLFRKC